MSQKDGQDGGNEEEERWIESDWLRDAEKASKEQKDNDLNFKNQEENDDDDPPDVTDLFADPDPMDTFQFTWTIDDDDDDMNDNDIHIESNSTTRVAQKKSTRQRHRRTIDIRLEGYKAELGQTLHSTGLTLWRASQLLSDHLVAHAQTFICGKRVIELGAGMGLCGILASHLGAARVLLTDGDTDALAQLRRNVQANCACARDAADNDDKSSSNGHKKNVTCRQLVWGRNLDSFVSEHGVFDVVLGSDIIYVPEIIEPLFETIERILMNRPDDDDGDAHHDPPPTFILAYARRNVPIDLVLDHAKQRGFVWTCPDNESAEGVFCFQRASSLRET